VIADVEAVVAIDQDIQQRAKEFERAGIDPLDALHIACAERGGADVFLTVDDVLLRRSRRLSATLRTSVRNSLDWLREWSDDR
jgi:predicted nucleic acid-binding protein